MKIMEKICSKCKILKPITMYHKGKDSNGYKSACKDCRNLENKKYEKTDKRQNYYKENEERRKQYRIDNKEKINNKKKEWNEKNKEKRQKKKTENVKRRKERDPVFALQIKIRTNINRRIKKYSKTGKTQSLSKNGINFKEIFDNLGPKPSSEYTLDHIIPIRLFDYSINEHIKLSNMYYNLQWITHKENNTKSDYVYWDVISQKQELLDIATSLGINESHNMKRAREIVK